MKQYISIFILVLLSFGAMAQKGKVGIRPAGIGTTVRYSADNLSTFTPTVAQRPLQLYDWAFDGRRGSWYYYNGSTWQARGQNNGNNADLAYTVNNQDTLSGWDASLYNRALINKTLASSDTIYIDLPSNVVSQIPHEIFTVEVNNNRISDADTMIIRFDSLFRTFDGNLFTWRCPPRARIVMTFKVAVSVEGNSWLNVDDILGSYGHGSGGSGISAIKVQTVGAFTGLKVLGPDSLGFDPAGQVPSIPAGGIAAGDVFASGDISSGSAVFVPWSAIVGQMRDSIPAIYKETGQDSIVPIPADFAYSPPFDILRNGSTYVVNPEFSMRDHANISVSKTYYVDVNTGNDGNDGLTYGTAFKSILTAAAKTDVDRIVISKGTYPYANSLRNTVPTRSIEWIGDLTTGTGDSVWITKSINEKFGAWSPTSNYYSATYTISNQDTIGSIYDNKAANRDAFGDANDLTLVGSVGAVDATPGSWFVSGTTVYIRTIDSRAPDSDIELVAKNASISNLNGRLTNGTHYFENINFRHAGLFCIVADSTGGLNVYINGARFMAGTCSFDGTSEVMLFNVIAGKSSSDIMNYDPDKGISPNAVEYNCWLRNTNESGTGTTFQASTIHNGCKIIRVNGTYQHTRGQNIADVNDSQTLLYGVTMKDAIPTSSAGVYANGTDGLPNLWLENCVFDQNSGVYDIQLAGTDTAYQRFSTYSQTNDLSGGAVLATYTPNETFTNRVSEMMETATLGDNDYLYLAKLADGEYLPVKLQGNKVAAAIGSLTQPGTIEGAREQAQKFRKGVHINGATGAALATKALSTTTPALKYSATTGQTGNILEGYNAAGSLIMRQLSDGGIYAGDVANGSGNFAFMVGSGNPTLNFGGKASGQLSVMKLWSGSTFWNWSYQDTGFNGDMIIRYNSESGARRFRFTTTGKIAIGDHTATAWLHPQANTASALSAPLKFISGTLMSVPEAGAFEFLTDKLYFTITTSAARKEITLNDAALTSGEIPVSTTNGRLTNSGITTAIITAKQDGIQYQDEGSNLGTAGTVTTVNFVGRNVTATRASNTITVTIPDTVYITLSPLAFTDSLKTIQELGKAGGYWNVPSQLNGYTISKVEYSVIGAGAGTGSVTVGLKAYNSSRGVSYTNGNAMSFSASEYIKTSTAGGTLATGQLIVPQITSDTIVTHPTGLTVLLMLTKA